MIFSKVLNEYTDEIALKKWNNKQSDLWRILVRKHIVDKNDVDNFIKFSIFFDKFYKKNHFFPNINDVIRQSRII